MVQPKGICPPATGPCIGGDATKCGTEKELDISIPALRYNGQLGVFIQGADNMLSVFWDNTPSLPDQTVKVLYRRHLVNEVSQEKEESRTVGEVDTDANLQTHILYDIWVRPETATGHGYWQHALGYTSDDWDIDQNLIRHRGDYVIDSNNSYLTHGG